MSASSPKVAPLPLASAKNTSTLARAMTPPSATTFEGISSTNSDLVATKSSLLASAMHHNDTARPMSAAFFEFAASSLSTSQTDSIQIIESSITQREPEVTYPHDFAMRHLRTTANEPRLPEPTQAEKETAAVEELDNRIQSLPQELQDFCYHWAVISPMEEMQRNGVVVSSSYTPPLALQISSKRRAEAADTYYSNTTFETPNEPSFKTQFMKWFASLSLANRSKVNSITFRQADEEHFKSFLKEWGEVSGTWSGYFSTSYACGVDVGRMSRELFKLGYDGAIRCWFGDYEEGVEGCSWTEKWCKNGKCIDGE